MELEIESKYIPDVNESIKTTTNSIINNNNYNNIINNNKLNNNDDNNNNNSNHIVNTIVELPPIPPTVINNNMFTPHTGMTFPSHQTMKAYIDEYARKQGFATILVKSEKQNKRGQFGYV
jgi:hypothetical protein